MFPFLYPYTPSPFAGKAFFSKFSCPYHLLHKLAPTAWLRPPSCAQDGQTVWLQARGLSFHPSLRQVPPSCLGPCPQAHPALVPTGPVPEVRVVGLLHLHQSLTTKGKETPLGSALQSHSFGSSTKPEGTEYEGADLLTSVAMTPQDMAQAVSAATLRSHGPAVPNSCCHGKPALDPPPPPRTALSNPVGSKPNETGARGLASDGLRSSQQHQRGHIGCTPATLPLHGHRRRRERGEPHAGLPHPLMGKRNSPIKAEFTKQF